MIIVDRKSSKNLYDQVYESLKKRITKGELLAGYRLPSTRKLSEETGVSRNTVKLAYQQLEVEGFIKSETRRGYFVETLPPRVVVDESRKEDDKEISAVSSCQYDFRYGSVDCNIYRSRAFRDAMRDAWAAEERKSCFVYGDFKGSLRLRKAIARELYSRRGVQASPERIIITSGHPQSLSLIQDLFTKENFHFEMEEPGDPYTRMAFQKRGYEMREIPLEEDGVSTGLMKSHALFYITPSHQYPMGAVLPIKKRIELLNEVAITGSYIIEDDYDSELRYRDRPVPSLQSIDRNNRVIYLGTFSKGLSPELRLSFVVLPKGKEKELVEEWEFRATSVSILIQETLANYIESGAYDKHLNIVRNSFRKKHDFIVDFLKKHFGNHVRIYGTGGGMHLVIAIDTDFREKDIIKELEKEHVKVYPVTTFWENKKKAPQNQIFIGYGGISMEKLPKYMEALAKGIARLTAVVKDSLPLT